MTQGEIKAVATIADIRRWRDMLAKQADERGEKMFLGKPDAWFDDLHWFCPNGHVSGIFLSGDSGDRCLACGEPVLMGPPMTEKEFPLAVRAHLMKGE
jgi:hypothetical protein